jgi:hypothetical protein
MEKMTGKTLGELAAAVPARYVEKALKAGTIKIG